MIEIRFSHRILTIDSESIEDVRINIDEHQIKYPDRGMWLDVINDDGKPYVTYIPKKN